jgi:hypothetical protein
MSPQPKRPWRRHVFFLNGFDPKGAAKYHSLYRLESSKQTCLNGLYLEVGDRARKLNRNSTWTVKTTKEGRVASEIQYEFLRWDDIVRRNWSPSIWKQLFGFIRYTLMGGVGGIWTVWRTSPKTLIGLWYPAAVLGSGLVLSIALATGLAMVLQHMGLGDPFASSLGLAFFFTGIWTTRKVEDKLNTTWLVRIFSFIAKQASAEIPELETRLDLFASQFEEKIRSKDVDEILVVGFSVGSILAVSSLARALQNTAQDAGESAHNEVRPTISLMTLGHCIPMLGMLPGAAKFRAELGLLAQSELLTWIDFSSPADWGSFALVDPVQICAIDLLADTKKNPVLRSPRFHTMFAPETYALLNRNKRRMHMQYLMAGELPSDYDYFAITAGPTTLAERYSSRQSPVP